MARTQRHTMVLTQDQLGTIHYTPVSVAARLAELADPPEAALWDQSEWVWVRSLRMPGNPIYQEQRDTAIRRAAEGKVEIIREVTA